MHKHGVVHRDLKPENVMVSADDSIKIIDFGIAMKEDARRITHRELSPVLGTPDYISPEQVKGRRGDQRSDIYALGAMLYEMLTGRPPFVGSNPLAVMNERVLHDPEPARKLNPQITPQLQEILNRALERDPRHRYATAMRWPGILSIRNRWGWTRPRASVAKPAVFAGWTQDARIRRSLSLVPILLFVVMLVLARR